MTADYVTLAESLASQLRPWRRAWRRSALGCAAGAAMFAVTGMRRFVLPPVLALI